MEEIKFDVRDDENSAGLLTNNIRSIIDDLEPTNRALNNNNFNKDDIKGPNIANRKGYQNQQSEGGEMSEELGPVDEIEDERNDVESSSNGIGSQVKQLTMLKGIKQIKRI